MGQSMQEYARVCQSMSEYVRVCQSMPECARVCQSISEYAIGWVDLGIFGKNCFDFFGFQETVSRNSYMTTGLYRYSLAQPAILPPAQHMRGTPKVGSFNLSISKIIFDK